MTKRTPGRVKRKGSAHGPRFGLGYKTAMAAKAAGASNAPVVIGSSVSDTLRPGISPPSFQPRQARRATLAEVPIVDAREPLWSLVRSSPGGELELAKPLLGPVPRSTVTDTPGEYERWLETARAQFCGWQETRFFAEPISLPRSTAGHVLLQRGVAILMRERGGGRGPRLLPVPCLLDSADQNAWLRRELAAPGGERYTYMVAITTAPPGRSEPVTWRPWPSKPAATNPRIPGISPDDVPQLVPGMKKRVEFTRDPLGVIRSAVVTYEAP